MSDLSGGVVDTVEELVSVDEDRLVYRIDYIR